MKVKQLSAKELARKAAIGKAAAKLFDRKGYLETSLEDISEEAKLSKGGTYYYFGSKHEILFFVLDAYMDSLLDGLEAELANIPTATKKVRHIALRHLQLYNSEVPRRRPCFWTCRTSPRPISRPLRRSRGRTPRSWLTRSPSTSAVACRSSR